MQTWYAVRVAGPRGKAIADIQAGFQDEKMPEGSPKSTILEVKRDEIRALSLAERIDQTSQFAAQARLHVARPIDPDDFRAVIGQHHHRERARPDPGYFDNPQALQRSRHPELTFRPVRRSASAPLSRAD
jgi:hypothetical protein